MIYDVYNRAGDVSTYNRGVQRNFKMYKGLISQFYELISQTFTKYMLFLGEIHVVYACVWSRFMLGSTVSLLHQSESSQDMN